MLKILDTISIVYLPYITVGMAVVYNWLLSKGKLEAAHRLGIVMFSCFIAVETSLALRNPDQINVLIFNVVNLWAIVMAFKGLARLKSL